MLMKLCLILEILLNLSKIISTIDPKEAMSINSSSNISSLVSWSVTSLKMKVEPGG